MAVERFAAWITQALQIGDTQRSLKQLRRLRNSARRTQSEPDLRAVVALAEELGDTLEGRDRSKALLIAFDAKQTLAQLGRSRPQATRPETTEPRPGTGTRHPSQSVSAASPVGAMTGRKTKPASLADQLKDVAALHAAGELSDEEFRRAKRKLLG